MRAEATLLLSSLKAPPQVCRGGRQTIMFVVGAGYIAADIYLGSGRAELRFLLANLTAGRLIHRCLTDVCVHVFVIILPASRLILHLIRRLNKHVGAGTTYLRLCGSTSARRVSRRSAHLSTLGSSREVNEGAGHGCISITLLLASYFFLQNLERFVEGFF